MLEGRKEVEWEGEERQGHCCIMWDLEKRTNKEEWGLERVTVYLPKSLLSRDFDTCLTSQGCQGIFVFLSNATQFSDWPQDWPWLIWVTCKIGIDSHWTANDNCHPSGQMEVVLGFVFIIVCFACYIHVIFSTVHTHHLKQLKIIIKIRGRGFKHTSPCMYGMHTIRWYVKSEGLWLDVTCYYLHDSLISLPKQLKHSENTDNKRTTPIINGLNLNLWADSLEGENIYIWNRRVETGNLPRLQQGSQMVPYLVSW